MKKIRKFLLKTEIFNYFNKLNLKKICIFVSDIVVIVIAWWVSYLLRFNFQIPEKNYNQALELLPWILIIQGIFLLLFKIHKLIPRFSSLSDLIRIGLYSISASITSTLYIYIYNHGFKNFPRSIAIINFLLLIFLTAGWRILIRIWHESKFFNKVKGKRTLIIGAGQAGEMLSRDMLRQHNCQYVPVAFVDDDHSKKGRLLHGIPVVGAIQNIPRVVKTYNIDLAVIAIPSADKNAIRRITNICDKAGISYQILPATNDLISGKITVSHLREVTIEDLLGRDPVELDLETIKNQFKNKTILVTGAGGSIGSELYNQIAYFEPSMLIALDASEYNLYNLIEHFKDKFKDVKKINLLGDIRNIKWLREIFIKYKPDIVFHAAAYKHVPIVEHNPVAGIENNIFGTINVATVSDEMGVEKFILISTDKAVNPSNIMGATKRIAEIYCQNFNKYSSTAFITTRFGNVLNSSGSVIPLFKKQIEEGGPVTVTHPEITRYFMTIPEACRLVLQAAAMGKGGEIFVLDMGEPVKIKDLAEQLIKLSGLEPEKDILIEYIGLRPGEKLFEELFHPSEKLVATKHSKILLAQSRSVDWEWFTTKLETLHIKLHKLTTEEIKKLFNEIIPEYKEQN